MSNPYTDIAIKKVVDQEVNKVLEDIRAEIMSTWIELDDDDWKDGFNSGLHIATSKIDKYLNMRNAGG